MTGQPALLYLVPCTLVPTYVMGWLRGETGLLWRGVDSSAGKKAGSDNGGDDVNHLRDGAEEEQELMDVAAWGVAARTGARRRL